METKWSWVVAMFLMGYLFVMGIGSAAVIIFNFPGEVIEAAGGTSVGVDPVDNQQKASEKIVAVKEVKLRPAGLGLEMPTTALFLLLAFLAGITGSFLHTAQSLSTYMGNQQFRVSWTFWYILRPWIGGVLGLTIFFVLGAGLMAGIDDVSPYGVVAFGMLAGWFSKTATDKFKEVFEVLFRSDEDDKRHDKLDEVQPEIGAIEPDQIGPDQKTLKIKGQGFAKGAKVLIGTVSLDAAFVSGRELEVSLAALDPRPVGTEKTVRVENPDGETPLSHGIEITFL